jgi:hypothetical protein
LQTKRRASSRGQSEQFRRRPGSRDIAKSRWDTANSGAGHKASSNVKYFLPSKLVPAESSFSLDVRNVVVPQAESPAAASFVDPFQTAVGIAAQIDAVIADDDMYEPGEPRPSPAAVATAKDLVKSAVRGERRLPRPEVSVYFGEIDVTWRVQNRLLRMIVFSDPARAPVLYFQNDKGEALTRGQSVDVAGVDDLSQKLVWLLG